MSHNTEQTKRASIYTLGCRLNQSESASIADQLQQAGYVMVPFDQPSDLGIIHTCTVTGEADAKSRKAIRAFVRRNPKAITAVIGCYAQLAHKDLADLGGVDLVVGNKDKARLVDLLPTGKQSAPVIRADRLGRESFTLDSKPTEPIQRRVNLKIQDGCDFMCSYCIIPFARGRSRSRSMDDLLDEARAMVRCGAKEIVLTGINLGTYALDDLTVLDVVQELNQVEDLHRLRIGSIEMTTIPEELFACMADPDHVLVPFLHIPLQSGSNTVLERMSRRHKGEDFVELTNRVAEAVPDLCVGTDVMVAFPGETDSEFAETMDVLEASPVAYAHVFKYSKRDGSKAAKMASAVSPQAAGDRSAKVRAFSDERQYAFQQKYLGKRVEVLFESERQGWWEGYTGNYVRVAVRSQRELTNEIATVRLERISGEITEGTLDHA